MPDVDDTLRVRVRDVYQDVADLVLGITVELDTLKGRLAGLSSDPPVESLAALANGTELLRSAARGFRVASAKE